jgi:predicted phosphodiesterase
MFMALDDKLEKATKKAQEAIQADEEVVYSSEGFVLSARSMAATAWGQADWEAWLTEKGTNVEEVTFKFGVTTNPTGGYWNKLLDVRQKNIVDGEEIPKWPLIERPTTTYKIKPLTPTPRASKFKTAVIGADTQIGFDMDDQGNLTPYHDDQAIDIFQQIVMIENPDITALAGDILDLTEQGRWAQEARFANTTNHALERGRRLAAETRARTSGRIVWIEGNHDKRMQGFMEVNAKSGMNLKKAGYPDSWPVMSIPNLVGLDEFDTEYIDAYPAGRLWITEDLQVIHGTKSAAKASTASQYANETPHLSTVFGHSHRLEIQSRTVFDRAGKIRTMNINPGCLCRIDGVVPSVHGARHLDGSKALYYENWQQGVAVIRFHDSGQFYVELVQIEDGFGYHNGQELTAS